MAYSYWPNDYDEMIKTECAKYGIDWLLIKAQISKESAFRTNAKSNCGALGLMQLMPATGKDMGVKPSDLPDPQKNIEAGVKYMHWLSKLVQRAPSIITKWPGISAQHPEHWHFVLAAYNGGIGYLNVAVDLCRKRQVNVNWDSVAGCYDKVELRGKRPDVKQITDYVKVIMERYTELKNATP